MAKKPEVPDPGILDGPELARFLTNKIENVEIQVREAINSMQDVGRDLQGALQTDLQNIKPICEQFPGLCRKVDDLRKGIDDIKPSPTTTISRAADNLALHFQECTDPDCRRAIRSRMEAVGFKYDESANEAPAGTHEHHDHVHDPVDPPAADVTPWDKLGITESKYNKHKSYYDDAIKNGA
jgi:hypothetical protein